MRKSGNASGAICACLLLFGCAGVTAISLEADCYAAVPRAAPGFRYFLPRPYLLVTELPEASSAPSGPIIKDINPPGFVNPPGTPPPGAEPKGGDKGGDGGGQTTASAGAPSSNTSFMASTANYMVKLIYLPDYSRPMAVTMNAGLLGTASMNLTLQDGWMLTGAT